MKRYTYNFWGTKLLATDEAEPECGRDFCDSCGDCLACYAGDYCPERPEHRWVVYLEPEDNPFEGR